VKKHVYFSIALTLLLVISGVVTIPMVSQYDHLTQNWIYALGRVPIILGASLAFYGRGKA
jgi:hypothetical protein